MYALFRNVYVVFHSFDASTGQRYDTQQLVQINMIHPLASVMTPACNHSKTRNYKKTSLSVSPQLITQ